MSEPGKESLEAHRGFFAGFIAPNPRGRLFFWPGRKLQKVTLELRNYFTILWRRKWIIVVTTITTVVIAGIGTFMLEPAYETSTTLRVSTTSGNSVNFGETVYAEKLMRTFTKIATSSTIQGMVENNFNLDEPPDISADIIAATELLEITVKYSDPVLAADIADFVAETLIDQSKRVRDFRNNPTYIVGPAVVPTTSTTPGFKLTLPLGLLAGLAGGIGLALLFENLDTTLYSREEIELTANLSTLGQIPWASRAQKKEMFMNGNSPQGEAFRRLRTNLLAHHRENPLKTLLVTSAEPGEGKSTVVVNLAYSIVQSGRTVIVVDCDLRRPTIDKKMGLGNDVGLSTVLQDKTSLVEAIQPGPVSDIHVLTSGPIPANPVELLASPQMNTLLSQLKQKFDIVLLDTPALVAVVDAAVIAPDVDGIVLVVNNAKAKKEALLAARKQLDNVRATQPLGIVVNRTDQEKRYKYYRSE